MLKWLKRILLGLISLILLLIIVSAGLIIYDANFGATSADFANMNFIDAEGQVLK
jgi:hypothetical protein